MISNPLAVRRSEAPSTSLEEHVAKLNNYRWVVASGKLFYIASRTRADGTIERYVERHA